MSNEMVSIYKLDSTTIICKSDYDSYYSLCISQVNLSKWFPFEIHLVVYLLLIIIVKKVSSGEVTTCNPSN